MAATTSDADQPSIRDLDGRDVAALTEYMTVLDGIGRARGADALYLVVSASGSEYLVDARQATCECDDYQYREPAGGCKHIRRVRYAEGQAVIPADIDPSAIDPALGEHVAGAPRIHQPATGGTEVFEADA